MAEGKRNILNRTAAGVLGVKGEPGDPIPDEITERTPPEVRARILAMFKATNAKYARPFSTRDRLAHLSVMGGNWEEYGSIVLQMAILDTLLSIEEKLDRLADREPS